MLRNRHAYEEYRGKGKVQGRELPSPKSKLNPMKMSWNNEVWKEVISKPSYGPREHCGHWIITTSHLLWDHHLSAHFLWQAAVCPVWRASKSQEKGRTVCAILGLCMERQSGGSRGTSTCLESGSPTVYQLWCTELTTCPWWVILFDRWVKLQCCVIRS